MEQVTLQMRAGVVGEDGADWLADEVHTASPAFARELVARNVASYVTQTDAERAEAIGKTGRGVQVVNADPVLATRDPVVSAGKKR